MADGRAHRQRKVGTVSRRITPQDAVRYRRNLASGRVEHRQRASRPIRYIFSKADVLEFELGSAVARVRHINRAASGSRPVLREEGVADPGFVRPGLRGKMDNLEYRATTFAPVIRILTNFAPGDIASEDATVDLVIHGSTILGDLNDGSATHHARCIP